MRRYDENMNGKVKPYDKKLRKNANISFRKTQKSVNPVAKDTNKTRRKKIKPTRGQIK